MEYNLNMEKILSLIVPIYGKKYSFVKENIKKNIDAISATKDVELILVFKSNFEVEEFIYNEFFEEFSNYKNVKIIEVDFNTKRTYKTLIGLAAAEGKYVQVIDCHHLIDKKEFNIFINFIRNCNKIFIYNSFIKIDIDEKWTKKIDRNAEAITLGAGASTFLTSYLRGALSYIDYDIVYGDDYTFPLAIIFRMINDELKIINNFVTVDMPWYIRMQGIEISTTSKLVDINITYDIKYIINNIYKILSKLEAEGQIFNMFIKIIKYFEKEFFIKRKGDLSLISTSERAECFEKYPDMLK